MLERSLVDLVSLPQPDLKTFFRHGRLASIPSQLKKRQIILGKLVEEFEPDRHYPEIEVNRMLVEFHEDVASLRREMISFKLMSRSRGIYRRI